MTMTQIQRDAMAAAQRGDWSLADAIELQARISDLQFEVIGGYLSGNRLRYIAHGLEDREGCVYCDGGTVTCPKCDGEEEVECKACPDEGKCSACDDTGAIECPDCIGGAVDCEQCNGSGDSLPTYDDVVHVETLNGESCWDSESDLPIPDFGKFVDRSWADKITNHYQEQIAEAERAKAEQAAANLPPSNQTSMLSEVA